MIRSGVVLCLAGVLTGCAPEPSRPRKTHLVVMPSFFEDGAIAVGEDAARWAYVTPAGGGYVQLRHSGGTGPKFKGIKSPEFAPRTGRLFYWAASDANDVVLVADHTVVARGFRGPGAIVFSKDGSRWAAAARTEGHGDERGRAVVIVDGVERAPSGDASLPSFSPDARHVAYLEMSEDRTLELLVDGEPKKAYPRPPAPCEAGLEPPPLGPTQSPRVGARYLADGTLVVVAEDQDGWAVFRDGTRIGSYPVRALPVGQPGFPPGDRCASAAVFAPTSLGVAAEAPTAAWWERPGGQDGWRVVVDGRPVDHRLCARWWDAQPPELSPDGRRVAYPCAQQNGDVMMVFDGREFGPYQNVWGFTISDDGEHVGYGAAEGPATEPSWAIYVDGEARTGRYRAVWRPRFAPHGDGLAWEAEVDRNGRGVLGLDRRPLVSFDGILWGPRYEPRGTVAWVIRKGRKITRIDVPAP